MSKITLLQAMAMIGHAGNLCAQGHITSIELHYMGNRIVDRMMYNWIG